MRGVLWSFITEGLWYFLDSDDIELCVLEDLHSYSRGRPMLFGEIGVIMGLLVETFQNGTVFVSKMGSGLHWSEQLHIWLFH